MVIKCLLLHHQLRPFSVKQIHAACMHMVKEHNAATDKSCKMVLLGITLCLNITKFALYSINNKDLSQPCMQSQ